MTKQRVEIGPKYRAKIEEFNQMEADTRIRRRFSEREGDFTSRFSPGSDQTIVATYGDDISSPADFERYVKGLEVLGRTKIIDDYDTNTKQLENGLVLTSLNSDYSLEEATEFVEDTEIQIHDALDYLNGL